MSLMESYKLKEKVTVGRNEVSMQYSGAVCDDEGVGYSDGDGDRLLLLYVPAPYAKTNTHCSVSSTRRESDSV